MNSNIKYLLGLDCIRPYFGKQSILVDLLYIDKAIEARTFIHGVTNFSFAPRNLLHVTISDWVYIVFRSLARFESHE